MNLLVTGAWKYSEEQKMELAEMNHQVFFQQMETDPLICSYDTVEGVICNGLFLRHPIEKFHKLRYIQLTSAGYDRVPMEYIKDHGITIYNAGGIYSIPMAEFAVGGVLQIYKQSRFFYENQKLCRWEKHRGLQELYGKRVCIVGCGNVGMECAKRFSDFGCHVTGITRSLRKVQLMESVYPLDRLEECLTESDIVILALPLTAHTAHIMNAERFALMKHGSVFVNIARGALVDTESLHAALNGRLRGAVLDVFEEEPLEKDHPLWSMSNVILTPHNSFIGDGNQERLNNLIMKNLKSESENRHEIYTHLT